MRSVRVWPSPPHKYSLYKSLFLPIVLTISSNTQLPHLFFMACMYERRRYRPSPCFSRLVNQPPLVQNGKRCCESYLEVKASNCLFPHTYIRMVILSELSTELVYPYRPWKCQILSRPSASKFPCGNPIRIYSCRLRPWRIRTSYSTSWIFGQNESDQIY